ncbi:type IV toxin-antitoxin system AbiEi family antitoxin domain-containing protein [Microbacterium aureliae]
MPQHLSFAEALTALNTREELLDAGWTSRKIRSAVDAGDLRRVQRNRYVTGALWQELWAESRHRVEVAAAHAEMRDGDGVFSHESAAVVWDLPLWRHTPSAVHTTFRGGSRASGRAGLVRHVGSLLEEDVVEIDGIRRTTLERTVFDLIRVVGIETAVAAADAGLRSIATSRHEYDVDAADSWRARLLERVALAGRGRGLRQADWVIRFADGRADRPGESVSRLRLVQAGFTELDLQVRVPGPDGSDYYVDLGIEQAHSFLEFDGQGKYLDEVLRSGRSIEEVVMAEKRREDWIRGTTQRRFVRVEDVHIGTSKAFAARLAAFGIHPPSSR